MRSRAFKRTRQPGAIVGLALSLVLCGVSVCAQSGANAGGVVKNDSGEALPGATVTITITNTSTGATQAIPTRPGGNRRGVNLQPGPYQIRAEVSGNTTGKKAVTLKNREQGQRQEGINTTRLALVGGMLIDGLDVPPRHQATVLIEGNRIVQVGPKAEVKIPPDATVIDTSGRTMLPGLIDTHVHLVLVGHGDYPRWFAWVKEHDANYPIERVMEIAAKQLLMAGVTSAVDLGAPLKESLDIRDRIKRGTIPGPRMSVSGPWLARGVGSFPPNYQIDVTSPKQAGDAVEELAKAGVDVIKAHGPLIRDDYQTIVAAAHKYHIKVHAHVIEEQAVRDAFETGADVLHHVACCGPPYSPDLVHSIAAAGRPVVPTAGLATWIYPATVDFPERLQDPQLKLDFPPDLYTEVQASLANWPALNYFATVERRMFWSDKSVKQWIEAGATMGMGTDSGTPMNFHTEALWRELKGFVDHGVLPKQVIADATRGNARILGKSNEIGTIEPGKLADIIVVDGNPLFDIVSLSRVEVVVKDGVVYKGGAVNHKQSAAVATRQASGRP